MGMKVVYVAGPYTGRGWWLIKWLRVIRNIWRARKASIQLIRAGFAPHCPHMNTALMDFDFPDPQTFYDLDMAILAKCDEIFMLRGWDKSKGSRAERAFAIDHDIPVRYQAGAAHE